MEKLNVAIADDNERMLRLLGAIIESDEELNVVGTAKDGEEAYNVIKTKEPDVVLLDIVMPKMDGFQVLREMSKDKELQHKSVIITTADRAIDAEIRALRDGAVDFLEKPYNSDIVKCRVDNIVTRIVLESEILEEKLDLANKTVFPLCTHEGSGMGRSEQDIKRLCPGAVLKKGLPIHGADTAQSSDKIAKWACS